jgi:CubicO group peptidase (beta-lactamase class C family)
MTSTEINGYCDPRFEEVKETLRKQIENGDDIGASFSATLHGETVIDIWGGYLDDERSQVWQEDTIVNVYSTTKTMSFVCALLLADQGELDFDAPVSRYWPEFASAGKKSVKVWHLMDHAAGLSGMDEPMSKEDLYDWEKMTTVLARQTPWWEPGTVSGYHALTQGYLIGEVIRRITGQTIGTFFRKEVAEPLDADFFIGTPESEFHRIGNLVPPSEDTALTGSGDEHSISYRTFANPHTTAMESRTSGWRKAEIPAANGHGNARAVARIHTVLANLGEAWGNRLFSEETARSVMASRISGTDLALLAPMAFGLGFGLGPDPQPGRNLCFWGGWGGSTAIIDQNNRLSYSYVMNRMNTGLLGDSRGLGLSAALFGCLNQLQE